MFAAISKASTLPSENPSRVLLRACRILNDAHPLLTWRRARSLDNICFAFVDTWPFNCTIHWVLHASCPLRYINRAPPRIGDPSEVGTAQRRRLSRVTSEPRLPQP
jgi:hypothetical protein